MQDDTGYKELEKLAKKNNIEIFKISAVTGEGISELFIRTSEVLKTLPKEEIIDIDDKIVYTLKEEQEGFDIEIIDGDFVVTGPAVVKLMGRVNIGDNESMAYLQNSIRNLGIEDKLRDLGIKEGDTVKILDWEFEWYE